MSTSQMFCASTVGPELRSNCDLQHFYSFILDSTFGGFLIFYRHETHFAKYLKKLKCVIIWFFLKTNKSQNDSTLFHMYVICILLCIFETCVQIMSWSVFCIISFILEFVLCSDVCCRMRWQMCCSVSGKMFSICILGNLFFELVKLFKFSSECLSHTTSIPVVHNYVESLHKVEMLSSVSHSARI